VLDVHIVRTAGHYLFLLALSLCLVGILPTTLVGDLGSVPEAGSVRLHRLLVRADPYRGHPTPEEIQAEFSSVKK
jgi:hypothetical protein